MRCAVGIDIGATKVMAALVDLANGQIWNEVRESTEAERGGGAVLERCAELAREVADGHTTMVGVGICEFVDEEGALSGADTLDWRGLDVAAAFQPMNVVIEADVRAAARAEALFGAGRPFEEFIYLSVGSGVSYCLVQAGWPRKGARGNAIVVGAPPVERTASGLALARAAGVARAEEALGSSLHSNVTVTAATDLGFALAALVNALDPDAVVIGGGLGLADEYRALVGSATRGAIAAESTRLLPIVPAGLGNRSGVVGAALCAGSAFDRPTGAQMP